MKRCLYCRKDVAQSEFTLEHVVPKYLGGAYVSDKLKTRDVCKRCNNDLGLFVDAGFEKDWFVSNALSMAAHKTYDPEGSVGLPLVCMGRLDIKLPGMQPDECCESWLGPAGELVFWVRPTDDRLYWYMGGNPRTVKNVHTRAYFRFSINSPKDPWRTIRTFKDAFVGRKVKKVLCTSVEGIEPAMMGFKPPDSLDEERTAFIFANCGQDAAGRGGFSMYLNHDVRFLAKLAIGTAYCLFGERALKTDYAEELYRALHLRPDDDLPNIFAVTHFETSKDAYLQNIMGIEGCVTLALTVYPEGVFINLNIDSSMNWMIKCAEVEGLKSEDLAYVGVGRVFVLSRQMQTSVELSLVEYIAHKNGSTRQHVLDRIESLVATTSKKSKRESKTI